MRKQQPRSAAPRARLPSAPAAPAPRDLLPEGSQYLPALPTVLSRGANSCLQDRGPIIPQARCSPGMGKRTGVCFYLSFYFAKHRLSLQRPEPHSFPAKHRGEIPLLAGSCAPASSMSGVKRTLSSVVLMESPSLCHLDTAPALCAP